MTLVDIDNLPIKIAGLAFALGLLFYPRSILFVARGFRRMPTSNVGLIILRTIGVVIICQIAIELIRG
jgi:hypothetical protein